MFKLGLLCFGFIIGLMYAIFTGVEDHKIVDHHAANYDELTGNLLWNDDNSSVH